MRIGRSQAKLAVFRVALSCGAAAGSLACGGTLDAGVNLPPERLPVDARNPVILSNDGAYDNWQGEYAMLLAQAGGPALAGIVVSTGGSWFDLDANMSAWQELVTRAKESGLSGVPDPTRSESRPLVRPADGQIESTLANASDGARFIVETSALLGEPETPVVVATGGRLTDVADAYLMDPTVADRIVVVASLGTGLAEDDATARMGIPNGEMDPWADTIVAQRLRYVQVSAYYDQLDDVSTERLEDLPDNPFGAWMREKQPELLGTPLASDQVSLLALGVPAFTLEVVRVAQTGSEGDQPLLSPDPNGHAWLVTASDGASAAARLWQLLLDPETFGG